MGNDWPGLSLQKRASRLALIEGEEESTYLCSDQDSISCDHEIQSREDKGPSDDESEIVELMNRVEFLKKERSVLWLRELKEWMDHSSDNLLNGSKYSQDLMNTGKENHTKSKIRQGHAGESSKYVSDSGQAPVDYSGTSILDTGGSSHSEHAGPLNKPSIKAVDLKHRRNGASLQEASNCLLAQTSSMPNGHTVQADDSVSNIGHISISPLTIDDISGSQSVSACASSPPHYQEDLLHRRLSLVDEILQVSAESFSLASSSSESSSSDECFVECGSSLSEVDQPVCSSGDEEFVDLEANGFEKRKRKRKAKRRVISTLDENDMVFNRKESRIQSHLSKGYMEDNRSMQLSHRSNFHEVDETQTLEKIQSRSALIGSDNDDGRYLWVETSSESDDVIEKYFNKNVADAKSQEICRLYMRCSCVLEPESVYRER